MAAEALWRMKEDPAALELFVRVVTNVNPRLHPLEGNEQYMAIRALGRIGPPAKAAVPVLVRRLVDVDTALAQTAAEVLAAIDPAARKK